MGELRTVEVEVVIEDSELNDWIGKKKNRRSVNLESEVGADNG